MRILTIPVKLRYAYGAGSDWPKNLEIELPDGDILPANNIEDMDEIKAHLWMTEGYLDIAKEVVTEIRDGRVYEIEKELKADG